MQSVWHLFGFSVFSNEIHEEIIGLWLPRIHNDSNVYLQYCVLQFYCWIYAILIRSMNVRWRWRDKFNKLIANRFCICFAWINCQNHKIIDYFTNWPAIVLWCCIAILNIKPNWNRMERNQHFWIVSKNGFEHLISFFGKAKSRRFQKCSAWKKNAFCLLCKCSYFNIHL